MPDLTKKDEEKVESESKEEHSEEQTKDDKSEESKETIDQKEEDAEEGDESEAHAKVDFENIRQEDDGTLTWVVNPQDKRSTVYKGKDLNELLSNAAKGISEKDAYIGKLRTGRISDDAAKFRKQSVTTAEEPSDQHFPEYGEIAQDVVKKHAKSLGVTEEMMAWGDDKWREFEQEHGALTALRKSQAVERLKGEIEAQYAKVNVVRINNEIISEETKAVEELLVANDIDPDEDGFDYFEILQKVVDDKGNLKSSGLLRNGRIVAEAAKQISKITGSKVRATVTQKTDEDQAKAREDRKKAGGVIPASKKPVDRDSTKGSKPPKSMDDAVSEAVRMYEKFRKGRT